MDIDFEELLEAPEKKKVAKFAPKNSKFKPPAAVKHEPVPFCPPHPTVTAPSVIIETDAEIDHMEIHNNNNNNDNKGLDDDEEEEEDQIVREIDVFFVDDAISKLYVMQYPLRPCWRPYELDDSCNKVLVKPQTSQVEVEMSVNVDSENFDLVDSDDKAMIKQVLSSAWQPPVTSHYALGVLMGDELYLNPVNAVVQLRPSMKHLKRHRIHDEDMAVLKDTKQFKKQSKVPGAVNEQKEHTEEWIPLNYHGETSQFSRGYMKNMVAQQASQIHFLMTRSDYIDSLCPITGDKPKPKGLSRSSLLKLPLEERCKTRLLEGPPVHRFTALRHIAPDENDDEILKVLQKYAHLVQGLWVAKSTLKYGTDGGEEVLLRNYALLQFSKSPIFHETQLPKTTKRSETMKGILDEFAARRDSCRDWKFKEHRDELFIKEYHYIVEEQQKIWDRVEPKIIDFVFPKSSKRSIGISPPTTDNVIDVTNSTTNVRPSKTVVLDETREALPKALQKLFQTYKVCSMNQIRQKLRDMAVSENTFPKGTREARAAAAAADAPQEELLRTLNQVAVNIHGSFVSISSPDNPQYDALRNIVIKLFLAEGRTAKLKKASIYAAANTQLKRDVSNVEYQKVLNELCVSQNSAWVLKSGDSPT